MSEKDPTGLDQHAPGAKVDAGKNRVALMENGFVNALEAVALVTTAGAEKYTDYGFLDVEEGMSRYADAAGRHRLKHAKAMQVGDSIHDVEKGGTGCLHKAQEAWNVLAELELMLRQNPKVVRRMKLSE